MENPGVVECFAKGAPAPFRGEVRAMNPEKVNRRTVRRLTDLPSCAELLQAIETEARARIAALSAGN